MKIIQILDQTEPLISGYSMRSRYITRAIQNKGANVEVLRSPIFSYQAVVEDIEGVRYHSVTFIPSALFKIPVLRDFLIVVGLYLGLEKIGSDGIGLIDAHSSPLNGLAGLLYSKIHNIPFLYEIRAFWEDAAVDQGKMVENNLKYRIIRRLETFVVQHADKVSVICEGLRNDLIERGIDGEKIFLVKNGVDLQKFKKIEANQTLIGKYNLNDKFVIGFVGTLFEFEGIPLLVKAADLIRQNMDKFHILIVGNGRDYESCKSLVTELKLQDYVTFTGRVPHQVVNDYYSVIDLLVYPRISKRITELVTPLKPLEAMAMYKPVLGSDVGGIKELVKDKDNGLLFSSGDVKALAEKCIEAINNPDDIKELTVRGRKHVEDERNWNLICDSYLPFFQEIGLLAND